MNKKLALLLAVLMLVVVVAGCGKSEPAKPAQPAAKAEPIIIAYTPWNGYGALFVAAEKGMFKAKGLDVQIQSIEDVGARKQSIVAKKIQGMAASVDVSVAALGQGVPIKFVWAFDASAGADGLLVTKASGIKSVADLKGKRVAVGALGSGTEANARQIMEIFGITYADIKPQYLSFGEAANGLKDGNIDVAFVTAGAPTAAIQDIAAQHKVALVSIPADKAEALIKKYPFYAKQTVKAKTYPTGAEDVQTVAVKAMLVTSSKVDADLVYKMTKAMYTNLDRIKSAHAQGANVQKATALEGMGIKVHAGADKFFKEK